MLYGTFHGKETNFISWQHKITSLCPSKPFQILQIWIVGLISFLLVVSYILFGIIIVSCQTFGALIHDLCLYSIIPFKSPSTKFFICIIFFVLTRENLEHKLKSPDQRSCVLRESSQARQSLESWDKSCNNSFVKHLRPQGGPLSSLQCSFLTISKIRDESCLLFGYSHYLKCVFEQN